MTQDRRHKRGREELEDTVDDQIRDKNEEIRRKEVEIRGVKEVIRGLKEDIRRKEEEIRGVEVEIVDASGTVRVVELEAKLDFLWQGISNLWQELCSRDAEISRHDEAISILRQELHDLWSVQHASTVDVPEKSHHWSKVMLLDELPALPRDADELKSILFPTQPTQTGKLPVTQHMYNCWKGTQPHIADKFLIRADASHFCVTVSDMLLEEHIIDSEVDVTMFSGRNMKKFFRKLDHVSPHSFKPKVLLNGVETSTASTSVTDSRVKVIGPDTLVMASDCTFLIGEEEKSDLGRAVRDLCAKVQPFSEAWDGPVRFMLGYAAAGTEFQWLYISHDAEVNRVSSPLDLSLAAHRSMFLLSLGYAYKLIKRMAESVPNLPDFHRAIFAREMNSTEERILDWSYDTVTKTIKGFSSHCKVSKGTSFELIKQAYEAGKKCKFLAQASQGPRLSRDNYRVKIGPLGCRVRLRNERDGKKFAQHVCEALSALHKEGLVHRDVRLPNIVKVLEPRGEEYYFMLIDLETVAKADFLLPPGFDYFRFWTDDTLEGSNYTPRSDMHHLGEILNREIGCLASPVAREFIRELIEKKLDAEMALGHQWLTSVGPS